MTAVAIGVACRSGASLRACWSWAVGRWLYENKTKSIWLCASPARSVGLYKTLMAQSLIWQRVSTLTDAPANRSIIALNGLLLIVSNNHDYHTFTMLPCCALCERWWIINGLLMWNAATRPVEIDQLLPLSRLISGQHEERCCYGNSQYSFLDADTVNVGPLLSARQYRPIYTCMAGTMTMLAVGRHCV